MGVVIERPSLAALIAQAGYPSLISFAHACRPRLSPRMVRERARGSAPDLPWISTQATIARQLGIEQADVLAACAVSRAQYVARVAANQERADVERAAYFERRDDASLGCAWDDE